MKIKAGKKIKIMSTGNTTFKRILITLGTFLLVAGVTYGFLALVNWTPDLQEWTGFSRFILGVEGVVFLIKIFEDL